MVAEITVLSASKLIDWEIARLKGWRGRTIANIRKIIRETNPDIIEDWIRGTPVWAHNGVIICVNSYKSKVKLTFSQGAKLSDPTKFFNNGLEGNKWRATDFYEGDNVDERALKTLVRAAIAYNTSKLKKKK